MWEFNFQKLLLNDIQKRTISKNKVINVLYILEGIRSSWNANSYHCKHDTFKYGKESLEEYAAKDSSHEYLGEEILKLKECWKKYFGKKVKIECLNAIEIDGLSIF